MKCSFGFADQRIRRWTASGEAPVPSSIVSFDVAEYCRYWNEEPADSYDILDLGSWDKDGNYTAADEDFRADLKAQTA